MSKGNLADKSCISDKTNTTNMTIHRRLNSGIETTSSQDLQGN